LPLVFYPHSQQEKRSDYYFLQVCDALLRPCARTPLAAAPGHRPLIAAWVFETGARAKAP